MSRGNLKMFMAARKGDAAALAGLLHRCDPLAKNELCRTALMYAAANGDVDCLSLLLPLSDPLAKDCGGKTAIMYAAETGNADCASLIEAFILATSEASALNDCARSPEMAGPKGGPRL